MIGSSNNPVSGIALSALIIAALMLMVIGASGMAGDAAVLVVAAVVCIFSTVGGEMPWPQVGAGIIMGIALVLVRVRSQMVVAMGMYLPLETTSAILVGAAG